MGFILGIYTALFSVVNPLGAIPVYLSLTGNNSIAERRSQALWACIYATLILIVFLLIGSYILNFFSITIESMKIAGGLIIMRSGHNLLNATYRKGKGINEKVEAEALEKEDISFSPLAMPMLSGPGSISLLLSISSESVGFSKHVSIIIAIILLGITTYAIFRSSSALLKLMGRSGIAAMSRIMGFIVMTIGIEFIISGCLPLLKQLVQG